MNSINVFTYNSTDYVKEVAKVGTNSDILLYHRKDGDDILTFTEPIKYPEKISSLTDSIFPSDVSIINANNIDRNFGEVIVSLDLMGKNNGIIIVNDEKREMVKKIISNTNLKDYSLFSGKPMELIDEIKKIKIKRSTDKNYTVIDHFFKVKGVGTVALGFVLSGKIEKHQKMIVSDIDREIEVKSIQMNDIGVDTAAAGSRVGLALKNIDPSDMDRGMILSDKPFEYQNEIRGKINVHSTVKVELSDNYEIFLSDMMRYQRGKLENDRIMFENKIPVIKKNIVLANNNIVPRVFGTIDF